MTNHSPCRRWPKFEAGSMKSISTCSACSSSVLRPVQPSRQSRRPLAKLSVRPCARPVKHSSCSACWTVPVTTCLLELVSRLWREIMASSTLIQADATVNVTSAVFLNADLRQCLGSHFGLIPVVERSSVDGIVDVLNEDPAALAAASPDEEWLEAFTRKAHDDIGVIGILPQLDCDGPPQLIIIGRRFDEPTGNDETLVASSGGLPRDFAPSPLWQVELPSGDHLTSLPGFLDECQTPLAGLRRGNDALALRVIGRYPSPIKTDK